MSGISVESKSNIPEDGWDEDQSTQWKKKLYTKKITNIRKQTNSTFREKKILGKPRIDISPMWLPGT